MSEPAPCGKAEGDLVPWCRNCTQFNHVWLVEAISTHRRHGGQTPAKALRLRQSVCIYLIAGYQNVVFPKSTNLIHNLRNCGFRMCVKKSVERVRGLRWWEVTTVCVHPTSTNHTGECVLKRQRFIRVSVRGLQRPCTSR